MENSYPVGEDADGAPTNRSCSDGFQITRYARNDSETEPNRSYRPGLPTPVSPKDRSGDRSPSAVNEGGGYAIVGFGDLLTGDGG